MTKFLRFLVCATASTQLGFSMLAQNVYSAPMKVQKLAYFFSKSHPYAIPTYDVMFKRVLGSEEGIRISFINSLAPDLNVKSAKMIDEYMRYSDDHEGLRNFLHTLTPKLEKELIDDIDDIKISFPNRKNTHRIERIKEYIKYIPMVKKVLPPKKYTGSMDCICETDKGMIVVEMQVVPQNFWDRRAVAYISNIYGNQLSRDQGWEDLKPVIGINLLGGGRDNKVHWENGNDYIRDYKLQDTRNSQNIIDSVRLIQYSLMLAPRLPDCHSPQDEWLKFFRDAHNMDEAMVENDIKTPEVQRAFELVKFDGLPSDVQNAYEQEDDNYQRYSIHTSQEIEKGREEGREKGREEGIQLGEKKKAQTTAKMMLESGEPQEKVSLYTGLSLEELKALATS